METEEELTNPLKTNLERLRGHFQSGSLAERLVAARIEGGSANSATLRELIAARIEELRRTHEPLPDQQA